MSYSRQDLLSTHLNEVIQTRDTIVYLYPKIHYLVEYY